VKLLLSIDCLFRTVEKGDREISQRQIPFNNCPLRFPIPFSQKEDNNILSSWKLCRNAN